MKAAVIMEVERIEIEDRDRPEVRPYHALVWVAATSLCGTDVRPVSGPSRM